MSLMVFLAIVCPLLVACYALGGISGCRFTENNYRTTLISRNVGRWVINARTGEKGFDIGCPCQEEE